MTEHYHHTIQGWTDTGIESLYREAVANAPDGATLVEVGCWKGKSLCYLLVEAANSGKQLRVCGIDHFQGSIGEPALQHEAQSLNLALICLQNCQRSGHKAELFQVPSVEGAEQFENGSLDFVFIDGSHDYNSVRADIKAWLPKVKPGGTLAGHDYGYAAVLTALAKHLPGAKGRGSCWTYKVPMPVKKERSYAKSAQGRVA